MKIRIGMCLFKPYWREHYIQVIDIGSIWFIAMVRNQKTDQCVATAVYPKGDEEYQEYRSAKDVIRKLRVRKI